MSKPKPITRRTQDSPGWRTTLIRVLSSWLITTLALWLGAAFIPGVSVEGFWSSLLAAAVLGAVNALIWPALIRYALPFTVWTLGLGAIALNGLFVYIVGELIGSGFSVDKLWQGIVLAIWLTLVNVVVTTALSIGDDDALLCRTVKRQMQKTGAITSDIPGVIFLEIDGLAYDVLRRAMQDGNAPNFARWVQDGSHRLVKWETDWSSQTGAAQTGLLLGSNEDIPAFRWWDKALGRAVASSAPKDVLAIEERLSTGKGLLYADGASRSNMYSGDAPFSSLTIATVRQKERHAERTGAGYLAYFSNPYSVVRTLVLLATDVGKELWNANEQARLDVWPRIRRGFVYSLMRAFMVVVQRDLAMSAVIGDVYAGRPVVYATFSGYDEVAHHSGIERPDTLAVLRNLDQTFERIRRATEDAPRPYRLVVLSDHGQSQGATFYQRYDMTLEELVEQATRAEVEKGEMGDEGFMHLSTTMTAAASGGGVTGRITRAVTHGKTSEEGHVALGPDAEEQRKPDTGTKGEAEAPPELVALASGNLGLISFPRVPGRLTLEQLNELHPNLIPTLRDHPAIGFLLVHSAEHGAVVIGKGGTHYLDENRVDGEDPLAPYGEHAAAKAKRTDGFPHVADIMVNSTYWPNLEEVAAFEELVGSHGGMGGPQQYPFLLLPSDFELPDEMLVGPGTVHRWMRRWLAALGNDAYADAEPEPSAETVTAPASP